MELSVRLSYTLRSKLMREWEQIYYLVGILICLTFYPRDIACLSIVRTLHS